ncbi:MAG: two-component regulator propeller domain-containing protein [Prolixibacteraceae bacterium]
MKRIYLIFLLLIITSLLWAENEQWQYHLSKIHTTEVVRGNKKIYFRSEGGIFYYNQTDDAVVTLTKIDGLSGSDFSGMEYSHSTNSLIVFYKNSMIDIISENDEIHPISDIKRKNISGDKSIYNATCVDDLCYLSCGFGVVVLDITNKQIKDTFIIGDNGSYEIVYDVAIDQNTIYAGTASGIKYIAKDAPNLLDYSYWQLVEHKIIEDYAYNLVEYGADRIWAVHQDDNWHSDRILSKHGETEWYFEYEEIKVVKSIKMEGDMLAFCGEDKNSEKLINIYQKNVGLKYSIKKYTFDDPESTPLGTDAIAIDPRCAIIDGNGVIWIADNNYGAIRYKDGIFTMINPGGPVDNGAFAMSFSNNKLWVAAGGRNSSWDNLYRPAVFQSYVSSENRWEAFNSSSQPVLSDYRDVVSIVPSPGNPNHVYAGTWGNGILEFEDGNYISTYTEKNSTLQKVYDYIRIGGMDFDSNGNLWVSNSEVENNLHVRNAVDGTWKAFSIPEIAYDYKVGKLLVSSDGNIWMIIPREATSGLVVMSSDGSSKRLLDVVSYFSNAVDAPWISTMNDVYDIAEDREGDIWVGTSKGVTVFKNADQVFTKDPFYASQPSSDENDGFYHPLLQTQTVTAIAVDGGNQKYLGTKNAGIFLVSADGTQEIEHFTAEDSPLISNGIISLEYDGKNGILYVGTDQGLVSLLTPSKEAFSTFTNVYAYPNPVRSAYEGDIYITGLMEDTNVKITSVSGQLVSEMTSVGGQAAWDGRDLAGNKVHTGVYLVMCASSDGLEHAITKILFIRPNQ